METVIKIGTLYEPALYDLGMAILKEHFRTAAIGLLRAVTPTYRAEAIHQSLLFVNGSSLEATIETFGLNLDASVLRETFYTWSAHAHKSAWSSATIQDASSNGASTVSSSVKVLK